MMIPKAKLVRWDKIISFNDWFQSSQEKFSNNLDKVGRSEVGLSEVTSFGGFPGLGIIITSDTFQRVGT